MQTRIVNEIQINKTVQIGFLFGYVEFILVYDTIRLLEIISNC